MRVTLASPLQALRSIFKTQFMQVLRVLQDFTIAGSELLLQNPFLWVLQNFTIAGSELHLQNPVHAGATKLHQWWIRIASSKPSLCRCYKTSPVVDQNCIFMLVLQDFTIAGSENCIFKTQFMRVKQDFTIAGSEFHLSYLVLISAKHFTIAGSQSYRY